MMQAAKALVDQERSQRTEAQGVSEQLKAESDRRARLQQRCQSSSCQDSARLGRRARCSPRQARTLPIIRACSAEIYLVCNDKHPFYFRVYIGSATPAGGARRVL